MQVVMHALVLAQESEGSSGGLGINGAFFISQLISFGIVFLILWRWGFPALLKIMDKRQAIIREGIENAEKAKKDLAEANNRAEQILLDARRQAADTIERASKNAQQEANRIIEEAQARAEQVGQQQIARIQQEANRARNELSRQVINLSIEAASKVITKSVDTKDNRRLVEEFIVAADQTRNN